MNTFFKLSHPLCSIFSDYTSKPFTNVLFLLGGVIFLAVAAQISVQTPFQSVPLTFQSAAVVFVSLIYGHKKSIQVVAAYLLAGALGVPVFSDVSSGFHVFVGSTGGYLIGFLLGAAIAGYLAEKGWGKNVFTVFLAALAGVFPIFLLGVIWLQGLIGWEKAYLFGVKPFMLTELIKLLIVALFVPLFWKKN